MVLSMSFSWFKVGIGAFANKSLLLSKTNKNERENDELYISMVDDDTKRKVDIPTGFLLGKNGYAKLSP